METTSQILDKIHCPQVLIKILGEGDVLGVSADPGAKIFQLLNNLRTLYEVEWASQGPPHSARKVLKYCDYFEFGNLEFEIRTVFSQNKDAEDLPELSDAILKHHRNVIHEGGQGGRRASCLREEAQDGVYR